MATRAGRKYNTKKKKHIDLQHWCCDEVAKLGGVHYNIITGAGRGVPDLCMFLGAVGFMCEVKVGRDKMSPQQEKRIRDHMDRGSIAVVVYDDIDSQIAFANWVRAVYDFIAGGYKCRDVLEGCPIPEAIVPKFAPVTVIDGAVLLD